MIKLLAKIKYWLDIGQSFLPVISFTLLCVIGTFTNTIRAYENKILK